MACFHWLLRKEILAHGDAWFTGLKVTKREEWSVGMACARKSFVIDVEGLENSRWESASFSEFFDNRDLHETAGH